MTPEQPPKGEHQANGLVEEAGKTIRDMVRVLKLQLEANINRSIGIDDPTMKWMTRWAAMMRSRFRVSAENKTAYEKQTGRRCSQEVVPFAEKVWYRRLDSGGQETQNCHLSGRQDSGWDTAESRRKSGSEHPPRP